MESFTVFNYILLYIGIPAIFIQAKWIHEGKLLGIVLMSCTVPGVLMTIAKLF